MNNFIEKLDKIFLTERFGEFTQKDIWEVSKKYKDDPLVFVHFSDLNKVGIYPLSSEFETPIGIYCYPVAYLYREAKTNKERLFATDRKFYHLIKAKDGINIWWMDKRYTVQQYKEDIEKLVEFDKENGGTKSGEQLQTIIKTAKDEARVSNTLSGRMWYILWRASNTFSLLKHEAKNQKLYSSEPILLWNILLRKALNYDLVVDIESLGIIHKMEPTQAIFTHKLALNQILTGNNLVKKWEDRLAIQEPDWDKIPENLKYDSKFQLKWLMRNIKEKNKNITKAQNVIYSYVYYKYAEYKKFKLKLPEEQPIIDGISKDPSYSYRYATDKEFKNIEPEIIQSLSIDPYYSLRYAEANEFKDIPKSILKAIIKSTYKYELPKDYTVK